MRQSYIKLAVRGAMLSALLLVAPFAYANETVTVGTGTGTTQTGTCSSGGSHDCFQSFQTVSSYTSGTADVQLYMRRSTSSSGTVTFALVDGSNTTVATAATTLAASSLTTSCLTAVLKTFNFSNVTLSSGTTYYLKVTTTDSLANSEFLCGDNSGQPFGAGNGSTPSGSMVAGRSGAVQFDFVSGGGGGGGGGGSCGLGCGGIPTAYKANFSTSTQQASVIGAVGDLGAFVMGFLPYILALIVALLILGTGVIWLRQKFFREGYDAGTRYAAGEIHKRIKDHL